jgi:hypothetical protein
MTRDLVNQQWPDVIAQENVWGFGQVIALLLLALPFVGFYEAVFGKNEHLYLMRYIADP